MANCSCIQGDEFNFSIRCIDVYNIEFTDYSKWMIEAPYVVPDTFEVLVTEPESDKVYSMEMNTGASTIITSEMLGFGDNCIPDGFYCFEAHSCYNCGVGGEKKYTKRVAILPQTKCKIKNLIATSDDFDKVIELKSKLSQIEDIVNVGKLKEAQKLFKILERELDKLNCKNCCKK